MIRSLANRIFQPRSIEDLRTHTSEEKASARDASREGHVNQTSFVNRKCGFFVRFVAVSRPLACAKKKNNNNSDF